MRGARGMTLLELMISISLMSIGLGVGMSIFWAERFTSAEQAASFRRSAAASAVLEGVAADVRAAVRIAPRHEGPGALLFLADGSVAAWYAPAARPFEIHRKVIAADGTVSPDEVVARDVAGLTVAGEGALATVSVALGEETRSRVVRRRHAE